MAYASNPGPMADSSSEDMYSDSAPMEKGQEGDEKEYSDEPTAVIPKALLAGKKFNVGDEVIMKIKGFQGDEVVIAYSYGDEKEGDKEEGGGEDKPPMPPPPPQGGDSMAGMME